MARFCSRQVEGTPTSEEALLYLPGSFLKRSRAIPLHLPQELKPQLWTANQHCSACMDRKTETKLSICPKRTAGKQVTLLETYPFKR